MNKENELLYFRTQVVKKYVDEVINRITREEYLPKKYCINCRSTKPVTEFQAYKYEDKLVYSRFCKDCLAASAYRNRKR